MNLFSALDEEIERDGFTLRASIEHDETTGAPWIEHDGHGPVRQGLLSSKRPGERVLDSARTVAHFYDFAEACRIARRDGWNAAPYDVPGEKPKAKAARAALADYAHLKGWCDDEWHWCGVVVKASKAGTHLGSASLWGIESNAGAYLVEAANELADEALAAAVAHLADLTA